MTVKEFLAPFYAAKLTQEMNLNVLNNGTLYYVPVIGGREGLLPRMLADLPVKMAKLDVLDGTPILVINEEPEDGGDAE